MESLFHFIVPTLILLVAGLPARTVLLLSPLSVLVDFDHWIVSHATFHNVFLPLAALLVFRKNKQKAFIAAFFLVSHLLFDINYGLALFYPLDTTYYTLDVNATAYPQNTLPQLHFTFSTSPTDYGAGEIYEQTWLSSPMLWMAVLSVTVLYHYRKGWLYNRLK